ncbi:MAG: biotin-dependent carboxyltransferase family protein [Actinomycetales bacterium]
MDRSGHPHDTGHVDGAGHPRDAPHLSGSLEVLTAAFPVLVQDLGRPGLASVGVSESGAADRGSYLLGARLLGQHDDRDRPPAALEITNGSVSLRVSGSPTLVLTGARAEATLDEVPVPHATPFHVRHGQHVRLATPSVGLRTYLSVRGGIDAAPVLGSRATDTLSGLGPAPLIAGARVRTARPAGWWLPGIDVPAPDPPATDPLALDVLPGPRADWVTDSLAGTVWTVSQDANRVGVRTHGTPLRRAGDRVGQELASEGIVRGAIQVPPEGTPVVFLADHPVTGGYPVVGVLTERSADLAAQARPGQRLRFRAAAVR